MSSDTSVVTITRVQGNSVELRVRTTTAGGLDDVSLTRSFALSSLASSWRRATERGFARPATPTPLEREIAAWEAIAPGWYVSESFMREHVARYIESVEVLARKNVRGEASGAPVYAAMARVGLLGLTPREEEERLCETMHFVDLRVTVTDPRWLEGLEAGVVFPSTAFDVWWRDPTRADVPAGAPAAPGRWRVYSMDSKYWMIRHDGESHTVHYGKIGTKGQEKTKTFPTRGEAAKDVARLVREKVSKGYENADEDDEGDEGDEGDDDGE